MEIFRTPNSVTTFTIPLVDSNNRPYFMLTPTMASGDFIIATYTGSAWSTASIATLPSTISGTGLIFVTLSASEVNISDTKYPVVFYAHDVAGSEWDDNSALLWFKPSDMNVTQWRGSVPNTITSAGNIKSDIEEIASSATIAGRLASLSTKYYNGNKNTMSSANGMIYLGTGRRTDIVTLETATNGIVIHDSYIQSSVSVGTSSAMHNTFYDCDFDTIGGTMTGRHGRYSSFHNCNFERVSLEMYQIYRKCSFIDWNGLVSYPEFSVLMEGTSVSGLSNIFFYECNGDILLRSLTGGRLFFYDFKGTMTLNSSVVGDVYFYGGAYTLTNSATGSVYQYSSENVSPVFSSLSIINNNINAVSTTIGIIDVTTAATIISIENIQYMLTTIGSDVQNINSDIDLITTTLSTIPVDVDTQLSSVHGSGYWDAVNTNTMNVNVVSWSGSNVVFSGAPVVNTVGIAEAITPSLTTITTMLNTIGSDIQNINSDIDVVTTSIASLAITVSAISVSIGSIPTDVNTFLSTSHGIGQWDAVNSGTMNANVVSWSGSAVTFSGSPVVNTVGIASSGDMSLLQITISAMAVTLTQVKVKGAGYQPFL